MITDIGPCPCSAACPSVENELIESQRQRVTDGLKAFCSLFGKTDVYVLCGGRPLRKTKFHGITFTFVAFVAMDVGETACKVPLATENIEKTEAAGRVGKKRKAIWC